jgi:tRNA modification GTPase
MDGLPVSLYDTAGLRKTVETVEREGMRRSESLILSADLVLHVTVSGEKLTEDDQRIRSALTERNIPVIQIRNKMDIRPGSQEVADSVAISALTGSGLTEVKRAMREHLHIDEISSTKGFVTEKRQQQLFLMVREYVENGLANLQDGAYDEIVLEELNRAMNTLSEITGRGGTEEILGRIFSSFCIGK